MSLAAISRQLCGRQPTLCTEVGRSHRGPRSSFSCLLAAPWVGGLWGQRLLWEETFGIHTEVNRTPSLCTGEWIHPKSQDTHQICGKAGQCLASGSQGSSLQKSLPWQLTLRKFAFRKGQEGGLWTGNKERGAIRRYPPL